MTQYLIEVMNGNVSTGECVTNDADWAEEDWQAFLENLKPGEVVTYKINGEVIRRSEMPKVSA